ncbi:hydrolase [Bradyrhizobium diazoefficiens]|uniref:alpha/beta hydrolase family protein n=1 Tax=Bradyrhizobium diazoefficiens TaxID=1355477 RepID=UPI00190C5EB8|nr:hydrolase [Bradyrhizobium diazoefficiens]QQO12798.1 hydrolase [Bradyrhizobium diazoefficiens]
MRKTLWAFAIALCCLGSFARAAGIQLLQSDPTLSGAIWYPCAIEPTHVALGSLGVPTVDWLEGTKDCPVTGSKLPLVVISHGNSGYFALHLDIIEALVSAGFVVAAINHPGNNTNDMSGRGMSVWASRPVQMVRLLDFMLNEWKDRAVIDRASVGLFGFSLGGFTGLVLVGGQPDFRRLACKPEEKSMVCEQLRAGDLPPDPPHDARIKAAVIVDPAVSFAFTRENLAGIKIPLMVWRSELGGGGVNAAGVASVTSSLPGKLDVHVVRAGHYAFLPPCTPELAALRPQVCTDPEGFDRAAFHREFDAAVAKFFRDQLAGGNH